MKKELLKGLTMLMVVVALAVATAVVSAHAQSSKVVADIPFEFSVGFMMMPAGEYSAEIQTNANNALMIRSADGRLNAVRLSQETDRAKNNKTYARFVFHRYGERYFLAEVWNGGDKTGRQLLISLEEKAIERELASTPGNSDTAKNIYETVEILAALR